MRKNGKKDRPEQTAFDLGAPPGERYDAQSELQKAHAPRSRSDLILPPEHVMSMVDFVRENYEAQAQNAMMAKAMKNNVVPFPPKNRGKPGMQSAFVDNFQVMINGQYYEKPSVLNFEAMRAMVEQTPVLSGVIMTRIRQVNRFCRAQENGEGPGFKIAHMERDHEMTKTEMESAQLLQRFFTNGGWEFNPRARKRLKRATLSQFMAVSVRDTLTMDSAPIETEMKRDRSLGIDGFYAVDGATIRLCSEEGYEGDDEIFALQLVEGQIATAYTYEDLIYEPRNPRSDLLVAGYGLGEVELLVRVVTGFLNAMTLNIRGFSENSIPRGMLHLSGSYDDKDLAAFKRYWNAMVKGVNNSWSMPVMVSKDQESKAAYENFGNDFDEMYFSKWMTFLTSIICAIYGMGPDEINFESFSASKSTLSGSDTTEKLADSKDKGLRPLLSYYENLFTDFIVAEFSDKYVFRWTGLDEEDADKKWEKTKLSSTWNEIRALDGKEPIDGPMGDCPVDPALIGPWTQINLQAQQPEEDFGQPDGDADPNTADREGDFGDGDDGADAGANDEGQAPQEMGKAFGLPVFRVEP
jgi:hypothetical protein